MYTNTIQYEHALCTLWAQVIVYGKRKKIPRSFEL